MPNARNWFAWLVASLVASGAAAAEEEGAKGEGKDEGHPTAVVTEAVSMQIGGEFRGELLLEDHGISKHQGYAPERSSVLQVSNANLLLGGLLNPTTEFAVRFNLVNPVVTPLDYGYGTHWFSKQFGVSIGKERVMQGGWDHLEQGYRTHAEGIYAQNLTLPDFDGMVALHLKAAGLISLQIVNDVTRQEGSASPELAGRWNRDPHPTMVLGWLGGFGPLKPLLDFGSYDNNKSRWIDVGLKTEINALRLSLDYHSDNVSYHLPVVGGADLTPTDTKTAYTVHGSYRLAGGVIPWLYYSYYDNKEASGGAAQLADRKSNSVAAAPDAPGGYTYTWDDNGTVFGSGIDFDVFGKNWNPFLAYVRQSGKFPRLDQPTAVETRIQQTIKLGILGQI